MARANLGELLGGIQAQAAAAPALVKPPIPVPPPVSAGFLALHRKEARLTDDQANRLSVETRRLNKRRAGTGERLTDNTLIRVAIDLLLARSADLAGTTEAELRESVGL